MMSVLRAALLGSSLAHSVSPEVHAMLFPILKERLGHDFESIEYTKEECQTNVDLLNWIGGAVAQGYQGANVTFPFKTLIDQAIRSATRTVRQAHSANVLLFEPRICAYSTDGAGFVSALGRSIPSLETNGYHLILLGAGGAGRSVLRALTERTWRDVSIIARSESENTRQVRGFPGRLRLASDFRRPDAPMFVVNATPVGQSSMDDAFPSLSFRAGDVAADLVYTPLRTALLERAEREGAKTVDGLGMLIEQAALSQYLWISRKEAPASPLEDREFWALHEAVSDVIASQT